MRSGEGHGAMHHGLGARRGGGLARTPALGLLVFASLLAGCHGGGVGGRGAEGGGAAPQLMRLRGGKVGGVKARDLWDKTLDDLSSLENDLRSELMSLRVAQQVGGQPGRVNRIKMVRKSIARVLTVRTSKRRADAFREVAKDKRKPFDARANRNLPKAMRQRLTKHQLGLKSNRALKALRHGYWGAGERPVAKGFRRVLRDKTVTGRVAPPERSFADYPPHKYGQHGRYTATGHIPPHAQIAMDKRKQLWEEELKRRRAFKASLDER